MACFNRIGAYLCALLGTCAQSGASDLIVTYSTDFATDPGWVSTDPANLFWQSASGTYRAIMPNQSAAVAFVPIDWDGQSFRLEYDVKVNSCGYSAGVTFGMFDPQVIPQDRCVVTDFSVVDCGRPFSLFGDAGVDNHATSECIGWQPGAWYRVRVDFDASTGVISATLRDRDTQVLLSSLAVLMQQAFPTNVDSLGMSRRGAGYPGSSVDYEVDNIVFSVAPQGPSCPADADGNGTVDFDDITAVIANFNQPCQ